MFKRAFLLLYFCVMLFVVVGCGSQKVFKESIKGKVQVVVLDRLQNPVKDAKVIFVSYNKYIGKAVTDAQGKIGEIEVNAQPDPLVKEIMDKNMQRGVVNIIASKGGYRDDVVFEAWVYENATTTQIIKLERNVEGERNEPDYTVNEPHRLEVIKYVDYYKNIAK